MNSRVRRFYHYSSPIDHQVTSKMELINHLGLFPLAPNRNRDYVRGIFLLLFLLVYLTAYHVLALFTAIANVVMPQITLDCKQSTITGFWNICIYILELNKVEVSVSGDEMEPDCSIMMSNHCSLVDHILFAYLAQRAAMTEASRLANSEVKASIPNSLTLPKVQFFSWFLIWKIPSLKLLKNIVSCDENWELDSASVVQLFSTTRNTRNREWIVLFPEVNIWTRSDADTQNTMWQKYYLPQLTNVLYPRFSGTINTLSALRSTAFTRLYDVTILYSRKTHDWDELDGPGMEGVFKPPSLLEILCSKPSTFKIHIHVKARLTSRLPVKRRRMEKWIEKTWFEKDILLETMKQESLAETQPLPLP